MPVLARSRQSQRLERVELSALGVISPPAIHVESVGYSGSLEVLFSMVKDHRVDLMMVALGPVCEAFFQYILAANPEDIDQSAAALTALAYLLERKAWMLLPTPEPEPDLDEGLALPQPTIGDFESALGSLRTWHEERTNLYFRSTPTGDFEWPLDLSEVTVDLLTTVFERLLERASPDPLTSTSRPRRSLTEQMDIVMASLLPTYQSLERLVPTPFSKSEAVWWFLALLELIRLRKVIVRQVEDSVEFARGPR